MHYRFSVQAGAHIGEQVADYVAANYFRPIDDDDHDVDDDNGGEDAEPSPLIAGVGRRPDRESGRAPLGAGARD
jgi:hypothetical protein